MRKHLLITTAFALIVLLLASAGCGTWRNGVFKTEKVSEKAAGETEMMTSKQFEKAVPIDSGFDLTLFRQVVEEDREGVHYRNVFISPESLRIALMMAYNGAAGETERAMAKVLGIEGESLDEVKGTFSLLYRVADSSPGVKLEIADSLWVRQGVPFKDRFIRESREYYRADVENITGASAINRWVEEKTHGMIKRIAGEIDKMAALFLVNAIYFKGKWTTPFDAGRTREKEFTLQNGDCKSVPLMRQSGGFSYMENGLFQAVSLPYGDNGNISMLIFLPAREVGLDGFIGRLSAENWDRWIGEFETRAGDIEIPRYRLEYARHLTGTLESLGMGIAFDRERADFSGMVDLDRAGGNVFMNDVLQKALVEVNEEGTEAAAATKVEMGVTSAPREKDERFHMVVDRPFFTVIRDAESGTTLFMGLITDPS